MMRPIPRKLLIHTADVVTETTDRWGEVTGTNTVTMSLVRIEPSSSITIDKQNSQIKVDAVMYYDCRLSQPADFKFVLGAKVVFEGTDYRIATIKRFNTNIPHHYEIGLSL